MRIRPMPTFESAVIFGQSMMRLYGIPGFIIHRATDVLENKQECFLVGEISVNGVFCGYM